MTGWSEADIPPLDGAVAVVTGANSGLGLRSATVLAEHGARVLLACRNKHKGEAARDTIRELGGDAELVPLDLADLDSVARAAEQIREDTGDRVDILINNAGVMMTPKRRTAQGFEQQIGINHLGHCALTWRLVPALRGAAAPRVVSLSSIAARSGRIALHDLNFEHRRYGPAAAYGQSKLATLLFALELDVRARAAGWNLCSVAAHPGYTASELTRNAGRSQGGALLGRIGGAVEAVFGQPVSIGALPQLYSATAADTRGGEYIGPGGPGELRGRPRRVSLRNAAGKETTQRLLWELSAELTGLSGHLGEGGADPA
ncbi:MAG: oxidoreductase [Sciscionella sp.]